MLASSSLVIFIIEMIEMIKKYVILKVFHYDRKIRTKFHIRPYTWNSHKKNDLMQIALTLMTLKKQFGAKIKGKF